ncbi:Na+/H+ antiporter NhaA [Canibacter oris]|uniref:Na(+)/H(+) antiporter NhaA n=1 Tax=Canibacter oris TaxID=1365628 RepID=A0A840DIV6_9MICO|nr:Na+/H+ antiporter NhaA [Canibacter oris]MBB4071653.1 NhaA family Na+:H+ antiporter [Canibacter oris]
MSQTYSHAPKAPSQKGQKRRIFRLARRREVVRVGRLLRAEMVGGAIIIVAALLGFIFANSPAAETFFNLRGTYVGLENIFGFEQLDLKLSIGHWAADGLLAIFFFLVGLELKHEFVHGELSKFQTAIVPVAAAFGGALVPAVIFLTFNAQTGFAHGWAIPTATDIAFAVAILGVIAPGVPTALRMFLLTLAVVDDLLAILIIAVFYTSQVQFWALGLALIPLALYGFLTQKFSRFFAEQAWSAWVILLPLGVITWAFFLISGVHATIAGVLLAFTVPVIAKDGSHLAEKLAFRFQPLSTGIAVPIFAFFSAGVSLSGEARFPFDPIVYGIVLGLVIGKPLGIMLTTWAVTKFTQAELDPAIKWRQVLGVATLAGIGFTVSLLIAELSFVSAADQDTARLAVMAGSILAIVVAAAVFLTQNRSQSRNHKQQLQR